MKVAIWALAIFVLSLFGLIMINLFGNITVTDQLNYTTMKNAVEASMYDALDIAHYRAGFCLCTDLSKTNNKWVFNDDSQYELLDITYVDGRGTCVSRKKTCEILHGEYRINKKVFSESLIRRFAEMVNNNKDYEIVIQDIIEYPPKVSVKINSKDKEFSNTDKKGGGYTIVNQMDAIIETKNSLIGKATPMPVATPTPTPTPTPTAPPNVPISPTSAPNQPNTQQPTNTPKPTATPKPGGSGSNDCGWHYVNSSTTCHSKNYTLNNQSCDTVSCQPSCPGGGTVQSASSCNDGRANCKRWNCKNVRYDQSFSGNKLSKKAQASARNSYSTEKEALSACKSAQKSFCTGKKDSQGNKFTDVESHSCAAVKDWALNHANGKTTYKASAKKPSCSDCTSIDCLG